MQALRERAAGCAFLPGKGRPIPIGRKAERALELVWTERLEEKSFASAGVMLRIIQSNMLLRL
jgi:hypothetical protein